MLETGLAYWHVLLLPSPSLSQFAILPAPSLYSSLSPSPSNPLHKLNKSSRHSQLLAHRVGCYLLAAMPRDAMFCHSWKVLYAPRRFVLEAQGLSRISSTYCKAITHNEVLSLNLTKFVFLRGFHGSKFHGNQRDLPSKRFRMM